MIDPKTRTLKVADFLIGKAADELKHNALGYHLVPKSDV